MALGSRRWMLAIGAAAATAFACNAIIGVEDVKLKGTGGIRLQNEGGEEDGNAPPGGDDDDDVTKHDAQVVVPEAERPYIALGFSHSCARMTNSTVRCWGADYFGQLGDGAEIIDAAAPTPPAALRAKDVAGIKDAVSIASGSNHTCIVRATGKVSCWGDNFTGQLGNDTEIDSSTPVDAKGIDDAISVGAGGTTTCIIHKTKKASCWGNNFRGGLGDGTTADSKVPVAVVGIDDIAQISPAANHTCAVRTNGELWCWGGGADGQLGNASLDDTTKPSQVKSLSGVAQVATASAYSCARLTSGQVHCWGRNADGQLGSGEPNPAANPSPISVAISDAAYLWAGTQHTCAVRKSTGKVSCWGNGQLGQLGIGPTDAATNKRPTPTDVEVITTARAVWTGGARTCAITSDNHALCWGRNSDGQLGNGSADDKLVPTPVSDF